MTIKQQRDIETATYFVPQVMQSIPITEEHVGQYLAVSEHGEKNAGKFDENPLIQGKRNRGLHMQLWEEGILEGTVPYYTLLHDPKPPRSVVDFMKKDMFKGTDADIIEQTYAI